MANKPKESKKIRDLIRIGIYTALWIAVGWIIACTIGFGLLFLCNYFLLLLTESFLKIKIITALYSAVI